ncbi:MAG: ATP-binding protein [Pseudomonadota bacterium]|nr:ATP-binding protein [Pseudomonadota bacterium]
MLLSESVKVAPRYQRAVRIHTDFGDPKALEGYICPESSKQSLEQICAHLDKTGQSAFTWTGPYGCGKSSLAIALGAVLKGKNAERKKHVQYLDSNLAETIWTSMKPGKNGRLILPLVGYREQPHKAILEGLAERKLTTLKNSSNEKAVLREILKISESDKDSGGLILILDEMGKFLEHAAAEKDQDIYFFQELAELASRSQGRLIVIGILHQAFDQYAGSLTKEARDNWAKIQGRFIDIPINIAGEEQIELISRAIENKSIPKKHKSLANNIGAIIQNTKKGVKAEIKISLSQAWPLHPVVTALLGPISRRRFGQNQRSIFGFLNSAEPSGFQDFINNTNDKNSIYNPRHFWEYLRSNLEPVILASPDAHRWSLAIDAVERAESSGGEDDHLDILKTIALVNVFSERSGLEATKELLSNSVDGLSKKRILKILDDLMRWSTIVYRKHLEEYALFAGSDFEFETAFKKAQESRPTESSFSTLDNTIQLKPVLAKRFYDEIGSQQWFDLSIVTMSEIEKIIEKDEKIFRPEDVNDWEKVKPRLGSVGQFLFVLNDIEKSINEVKDTCLRVSEIKQGWINIIGCPLKPNKLIDYADELSILDHIWSEFPELSSDSVARREIEYQSELIESMLQIEFQKVFAETIWFETGKQTKSIKNSHDLSIIASEIISNKLTKSPIIKNELVNRTKPSGSANSAIKKLLKQMVLFEGEDRLNIKGYPAEWGVFQSILVNNDLYKKVNDQWIFASPSKKDKSNLYPAWKAGLDHLKKSKKGNVSVAEIYDIWSSAPFGIKAGLHNILMVALILSERENIAFYRENIFQSNFSDLDIDYLTNDPDSIQLRWMDLDESSRNLLSMMAALVEELTTEKIQNADPLSVARALISIYDNIHASTYRTQRLSEETKKIRIFFKKANDPNKFLLDDLPSSFKHLDITDSKAYANEITHKIKDGLNEMINFYPEWMAKLRTQMFDLMEVYSNSEGSILELRNRAANVIGSSGNTRLEAFILRLQNFDLEGSSMDEIASLCISKPTNDWVDNDYDQASIEIADLSQEFVRLESLAFVKGKKANQNSMSIVIGEGGRTTISQDQFLISTEDKKKSDKIKKSIQALLKKEKLTKKIMLSALSDTAIELIDKGKKK